MFIEYSLAFNSNPSTNPLIDLKIYLPLGNLSDTNSSSVMLFSESASSPESGSGFTYVDKSIVVQHSQ